MAIIVEREDTRLIMDGLKRQHKTALEMQHKPGIHETTLHYWDGKASVLGDVIRQLEGKRIVKGRDSF